MYAPKTDRQISQCKMHSDRKTKRINSLVLTLRPLNVLASILMLSLALSACASPPRKPAVFARPECQVEPQPLSCAGGEDAGVFRSR